MAPPASGHPNATTAVAGAKANASGGPVASSPTTGRSAEKTNAAATFPDSSAPGATKPDAGRKGRGATIRTGADAVSVVELLEQFPVDAEVPASVAPVAAAVEVAEAPWAPERQLVRVVVKAAPPAQKRTAAANVVLLVDVSGSMDAPNRLPLVQEVARRLVRDLGPDDRVALVTYAGEARVALPPTPVSRPSEIVAAIRALHAEGMTNGSAGLRRAYEVARAGLVPGGVNRVVLCTDGDFNMGVTSESELAALVEREEKAGVGLAVFGFGRGRQIDARLEALATKGRGGSGNVNSAREAEARVAAEVNGWRAARVRQVRVDLDCDPARVAACRLVGSEEGFLPPEAAGRRSLELSELMPGESATALFELLPTPDRRARMPQEALGLTLRVGYALAEGGAPASLRVPVPAAGARFAEASAGFKFTAAIAGLGLALRESPLSRDRLNAVITWAEAAAADRSMYDPSGYREEFLALAREARELAPPAK
jgi:Ca-activated chloride channel family protein